MNAKQKCVVALATVTFVTSFLFAPWEVTVRNGSTILQSNTDSAPLWSAPSVDYGTARLRVEVLVLEWTAIAIVGGCLFLLLKKPRRTNEQPADALPLRGGDAKQPPEPVAADVSQSAAPQTKNLTVGSSTPESATNKISATSFFQWVCLIGAAIGCSAYLSHLRYLGGDSIGKTASLALAEATGGALVLLGVPVLISFLFKRGSRFAVHLVGLCVMIFLNWLAVEDRAKPAAEFVSEVNERRADWKKDVTEQLETKGIYEVDLAKAEQAMDAVKKKTQQLHGKAKVMGEAIFSVNDQMLVLAKIYEAARKQYVDSGGTDASTIRTLDQLEAREMVIRDFGKANEGLLSFLQNIDTHLNVALANVELTPQQRSLAIQNYKKGASLEVLLAIRELDQEVANDSMAVMNLLRKEWGKWKVQNNTVLFDRGSAATEFNSILGRISTAGEKQVELQRRFTK